MVGERSNDDEDDVDNVPDTESTGCHKLEQTSDDVSEVETIDTDISKEDGQDDGDAVRAVRLAHVVRGVSSGKETVRITLVMVVALVVVEQTDNRGDNSNGSQEPESKVALAVGVDMDDGATIEGVIGMRARRRLAVEKSLLVLSASAGGSVVGHVVKERVVGRVKE